MSRVFAGHAQAQTGAIRAVEITPHFFAACILTAPYIPICANGWAIVIQSRVLMHAHIVQVCMQQHAAGGARAIHTPAMQVQHWF